MAKFLRHSDTIQAFLNEACEIGSNKFYTLRSEAYESYKSYCDEFGLEPKTTKRFTQQLRETKRVFDHKKMILGKAERVWTGLQVRSMGNEADEAVKAGKHTKENKINKYFSKDKQVPQVPHESPYFTKCYFCCETLPEKGWVSGELSEHKPAHTTCYTKKEQERIEGDLM